MEFLTAIPLAFHSRQVSTFVAIALYAQSMMMSITATPLGSVHFEITQPPTFSETAKDPEQVRKDGGSKITFPLASERKCILNLNLCNIPDASKCKSDPMCGTDGMTYKNLDELNCCRSQCQPDLSIRSVGECSGGLKSTKGRQQRLSSKYGALAVPKEELPSSKAVKCNPDECGCPNEFQPVCGSDGITYGNECLMECNKKCSPGVTQFHSGYCGKLFFRDRYHNNYQEFSSEQKPLVFLQSNQSK